MQAKKILNSHEFQLNVCFKKTWTNYNTVSLLWFVQVFLNQTLDSLCPGNLDEVFHVPIPSWEKSVPTDESQHHCHLERGGATRTKGKRQIIWPPNYFL